MTIEKQAYELPSSSKEAQEAADRMNKRIFHIYQITIDFLLQEEDKYSLWAGEGKINEFIFKSHLRITENGEGYDNPLVDAEMLQNIIFRYNEKCISFAEKLKEHYREKIGENWRIIYCPTEFGEEWHNQISISKFSYTRGRDPSSEFQEVRLKKTT